MSDAENRSTLTHELIHLDRGPSSTCNDPEEDARVELLAAQRLIDPVLYVALTSRWRPRWRHVQYVLNVDRGLFDAYATWRPTVDDNAAEQVWREAQRFPTWPPPWAAT